MQAEIPTERNQIKPAPEEVQNKYKSKIIIDNKSTLDPEIQKGHQSVRLDFSNVCLDVDTKQGKKRILNNVSGYVLPGEILYIMGPSGGGKTTLLDYLTNRTFKSPEDCVYLNYQKWTQSEFKKVARYCKQHPQLYEIFTVYETLMYAASFFTKNKQQRIDRVNEVIEMLGLEQQRDTKIGGVLLRGVSGGQKQRVSVGEQLVADPSILFLDEPTSGLDSASAYQLMSQLKVIAQKKQITVISSIHQPSQRVFDLSDRLIFLAGGKNFGGNTAYFGKTKLIEQHFRELGIVNTTSSSMSEWVLDEVNGDFGNPENIKNIIDKFKTSAAQKKIDQQQKFIEDAKQQNQQIGNFKYTGSYTKQSTTKDFLTLLERGLQNNLKNPLASGIRIITYCVMSLIIGTCWYQTANDPKAGEVVNMQGVLFFMASFMSIMCISILPINIEDKQIMIKEKSNGCYSQFVYQISNFLTSIPFTIILSLTSGSICFFLVGFENDNGVPYISFIIDLFVTILASEALILCIAYMFDHLLVCIVLVAQIFGTFMIMNGFFIKKDDIPDYWIWIHYLAFNTYSFQNFMYNAFNDITIRKDLNINPPAVQDFPGKLILKDLSYEDVNTGINILIVLGFVLVFRLYAYLWSYYKHTGKK